MSCSSPTTTLTTEDVAAVLHCSLDHVRDLVQQKMFPPGLAFKAPGWNRILFDATMFEEWLRSEPIDGTLPPDEREAGGEGMYTPIFGSMFDGSIRLDAIGVGLRGAS